MIIEQATYDYIVFSSDKIMTALWMIVVSCLSCYIDYDLILRLSIFSSSDNDTMTHKFGFLTHQYRDLSRPRFDRLECGAYMMTEMVRRMDAFSSERGVQHDTQVAGRCCRNSPGRSMTIGRGFN